MLNNFINHMNTAAKAAVLGLAGIAGLFIMASALYIFIKVLAKAFKERNV